MVKNATSSPEVNEGVKSQPLPAPRPPLLSPRALSPVPRRPRPAGTPISFRASVAYSEDRGALLAQFLRDIRFHQVREAERRQWQA